MVERSFKILQRFGNQVPSMASCSRCHYKFLTPSKLQRDPIRAEQYLREKFDFHECKEETLGCPVGPKMIRRA
jgi:hypothetical protein